MVNSKVARQARAKQTPPLSPSPPSLVQGPPWWSRILDLIERLVRPSTGIQCAPALLFWARLIPSLVSSSCLFAIPSPLSSPSLPINELQVLFDRLPVAEQERARSLTAVYSNEYTAGGPTALDAAYGLRMSACGTRRIRASGERKLGWKPGRFTRPVVEVGLDGRERLLAGAKGLECLEGMGTDESCAELSRLLRLALAPLEETQLDDDLRPVGTTTFDSAAVYVHKWQKGQALLWDNHRMLHSTAPLSAYQGDGPRLMWQIISKAEAMAVPDPVLGAA